MRIGKVYGLSRWVCAALLTIACLNAQAINAVQERNWTVRTAWGPLGVYKLSYSEQADSISGGQTGYLRLCGGPLGSVTLNMHSGKAQAQRRAVAPVLLAIGVFAIVAWTYRRKPEFGSP